MQRKQARHASAVGQTSSAAARFRLRTPVVRDAHGVDAARDNQVILGQAVQILLVEMHKRAAVHTSSTSDNDVGD
jgi:hypothetical protein